MSRALTPDELLFVVRVQHDTIVQLLNQVADARHQTDEACQLATAYGEFEGRMAGAEEMAREMADWFAPVARLVRQRAGHPSYAERAAAEAEWIKPKPGDYTGQLTAAEYFGTDTEQHDEPPQLPTLERRAA